jgi:hypothetical protein
MKERIARCGVEGEAEKPIKGEDRFAGEPILFSQHPIA